MAGCLISDSPPLFCSDGRRDEVVKKKYGKYYQYEFICAGFHKVDPTKLNVGGTNGANPGEIIRTNKLDCRTIRRRKDEFKSYKKLTPPRVTASNGEFEKVPM